MTSHWPQSGVLTPKNPSRGYATGTNLPTHTADSVKTIKLLFHGVSSQKTKKTCNL